MTHHLNEARSLGIPVAVDMPGLQTPFVIFAPVGQPDGDPCPLCYVPSPVEAFEWMRRCRWWCRCVHHKAEVWLA